ncbi:MAG: EAL domain-containing protein [Gammaproteobacteria bacterium]
MEGVCQALADTDLAPECLEIEITEGTLHDLARSAHLLAEIRALGLGHTLGLKVVAEGVETEVQLAFLKQQGCDVAQGYLIARPMPAEGLSAFLALPR